jgi:ankyrin repeat protein
MQLHAATARGDVDGITFALKSGTDINARNSIGETALVFALRQSKAFSHGRGPTVTNDAVQFLLEAGVDLEAADHLDCTAVHYAVKTGDIGFLRMLLAHGANVKHHTKSGYSVLTLACFQPAGPRKQAIIRELCDLGVSLDAASAYGEFPLGVCLRFGDLKTMRTLVELGADTKPLNWIPLHHAVAFGSVSEIREMRPSAGAINKRTAPFELSPWLLAFVRGDVGIIGLLAELGADLTQIGRCGQSALHLAAEFGCLEALAWLLDLGTAPNILNDFAETPLHRAAEWNHAACVEALINHGANATQENHTQGQPIHAAESVEVIRLLVELGGADVNAVAGAGEWPLQLAAGGNDVERGSWNTGRRWTEPRREKPPCTLRFKTTPEKPSICFWPPARIPTSRMLTAGPRSSVRSRGR